MTGTTDIASLGIEVESKDVDVAEKRLGKMNKTGADSERWAGRFRTATDRLNNTLKTAAGRFQAMYRQVFSLKGLFATLGVGLVAKSFLDAARTTENYSVRLKTLLGSVERGNELFAQLGDLAARVPFEFQHIMDAGTTLSTVIRSGVDDITLWTEITADLAAAFGIPIQQASEQMVRALSAGASAADTFREKGVNAFLGFQAGVSVSAAETQKRIIEQWERTDSAFRGATLNLAKTWDGTMSMLSDKWFQFRNAVMNNGPFEFMKAGIQVLDQTIGLSFDEITQHGKTASDALMRFIENALLAGADVIDTLRPLFAFLWDSISSFVAFSNSLPQWARELGLVGALIVGPRTTLVIAGVFGMVDKFALKMDQLFENMNMPQGFRDFMLDPTGTMGVIGQGESGLINIPQGSLFGTSVSESARSKVEATLTRIRQRMAENRAAVQAEAGAAGAIPATATAKPGQARIDDLKREREELERLIEARMESKEAFEEEKRVIESENAAIDLKLERNSIQFQMVQALTLANLDYKETLKEIEEAEKNHTKAVDDINDSMRSLFPTFDNLKREADEWRANALANLDVTKVGYAGFVEDVEIVYGEMLKDAQAEDLQNSRQWADGVNRALIDYVDNATNAAAQWEDVTTNALSSMEDAFVKWRRSGEFNANEMVNSILDDLTRLAVRQQIVQPLASFLGMSFHTGGLVGSGGSPMAVNPGAFLGAERFHGGGLAGLGPNEVPIIAEREEEILTRSDPRHRFNGGLASGFSMVNHINITLDGNAGTGENNREMAEDLGNQIEIVLDSKMSEWVRNQSRPGGMLNTDGSR